MPQPSTSPRISIVTPSFNQARFLEAAITSVLLQDYDDFEHIVIDGGSTDGSVEIMERHAERLAYCVSEPDGGQADAINKGFARATGNILGWINSDDELRPGALRAVSAAYVPGWQGLIAGPVDDIDEEGRFLRKVQQTALDYRAFVMTWKRMFWHRPRKTWHQQGVLFTRGVWEECGPMDTSLRYGFDSDFFRKALARFPVKVIEQTVATYRFHGRSKTMAEAGFFVMESFPASAEHWDAAGVKVVRWPSLLAAAKVTVRGLQAMAAGRLRASFRMIGFGLRTFVNGVILGRRPRRVKSLERGSAAGTGCGG